MSASSPPVMLGPRVRFKVSAPGKVIAFGEHSVVYQKPAIAGAVQIRNTLRFEDNDTHIMRITFAGLELYDVLISCSALNELIKQERIHQEKVQKTLPADIEHDRLYAIVEAFVLKNVFATRLHKIAELRSVAAVVYLVVGMATKMKVDALTGGAIIHMEPSEMSIGAGLGSSASFGVCLAGALFTWFKQFEKCNFVDEFQGLTDEQRKPILDEISAWAFLSERIMHGQPSGLDNAICTYGNVVKFYKGRAPESIALKCPIPVLLIDSGVTRSTKDQVDKVVALRKRFPSVVNSIFDAMGHLVEEAATIMAALSNVDKDIKFVDLENLVAINNNLLRALNVSHPELERIFRIVESHGCKGKLSGAGGGGYVVVLLGTGNTDNMENYKPMIEELTSQKYKLTITTLGGAGFELEPIKISE